MKMFINKLLSKAQLSGFLLGGLDPC